MTCSVLCVFVCVKPPPPDVAPALVTDTVDVSRVEKVPLTPYLNFPIMVFNNYI